MPRVSEIKWEMISRWYPKDDVMVESVTSHRRRASPASCTTILHFPLDTLTPYINNGISLPVLPPLTTTWKCLLPNAPEMDANAHLDFGKMLSMKVCSICKHANYKTTSLVGMEGLSRLLKLSTSYRRLSAFKDILLALMYHATRKVAAPLFTWYPERWKHTGSWQN